MHFVMKNFVNRNGKSQLISFECERKFARIISNQTAISINDETIEITEMNFMYLNITFDAKTREFKEIKKETQKVENIIRKKIWVILFFLVFQIFKFCFVEDFLIQVWSTCEDQALFNSSRLWELEESYHQRFAWLPTQSRL